MSGQRPDEMIGSEGERCIVSPDLQLGKRYEGVVEAVEESGRYVRVRIDGSGRLVLGACEAVELVESEDQVTAALAQTGAE